MDESKMEEQQELEGIIEKEELLKKIKTVKEEQRTEYYEKTITRLINEKNQQKMLLKEMHHRIKNTSQIILSSISIQEKTMECEEGKNALIDMKNRIKTFTSIYEHLYMNDDLNRRILTQNQLTNLITKIYLANSTNNNITLNLDIKNHYINKKDISTYSLLINELITNLFKHGFTEKNKEYFLNFQFYKDDELFETNITNNGNRFPEDFSHKQGISIGSKMVYLLTEQLKGKITIEQDEYVNINISFPEKKV